MTNFTAKKEKLLSELYSKIQENPRNEVLKSLYQILNLYKLSSDPTGISSNKIKDGIDHDLKIGEEIIKIESFYSDLPELTNTIHSTALRRLAKKLIEQNIRILFIGQAWSGNTKDWIYFDTVLDLNKVRKDFSFDDQIIVHQNLDIRSGLEGGFIDKITGEGIMGKLR